MRFDCLVQLLPQCFGRPPLRFGQTDLAHQFGDLRLRSPDYILLAVREEDGAWIFNPKVDDVVCSGSTIIALANPSGRAQLKAHLIEMIA